MTLEELAKWNDEKADSFAQKAGEMYRGSHARAMWSKYENMFRTSSAAIREALAWRKGNKHNVFPEDEVAETDRLLRECK